MRRIVWWILALLVLAQGSQAVDQFYEVYNVTDADLDSFDGGTSVQLAPFLPTTRADLPIDVDDARSDFHPGVADVADDLDNDGDGVIDGSALLAPVLEIRDAPVEIPGDFIDNDGDFVVDEPPVLGGSIVPDGTLVEGGVGDPDLVFAFFADNAYVEIQAYPTGTTSTGGHQPSVPDTDPEFCQYFGNITIPLTEEGDWLVRVIAYNAVGIDVLEITVRVLAPFQPDGQVGRGGGNDIYGTFAGQTVKAVSRRARKVKGSMLIQNDGASTDTITGRGSRGDRNFRARYASASQGNITAALATGTFSTISLDQDDVEVVSWIVKPVKKRLRKVVVRNGTKKIRWKRKTIRLDTFLTSQGDSTKTDRVRIQVKHR